MIRNIFFLFAIIYINSFNSLFAQETWEQDSAWVEERKAIISEIDYIFANLDKNKISSGFLYDRVILPGSKIENFDGIKDSIIDEENWYQMHYELTQFASLSQSNSFSTYQLDSIRNALMQNNIIPLGVISLQYQKIKEDAITNGWIYEQNGQLFENPNAPESPYETITVFAVTPLSNNANQAVIYKLDKRFYLSDNNNIIQNISIDFGDGNGFRTISWDDEVQINYSNDMEAQISVKADINNNTLQSNSINSISINIDPVGKTSSIKGDCNYLTEPDDKWDIETTEKYADFDKKDPPLDGIWARGRAYIKYGCGNSYIDKPLIFVEGIDFGASDGEPETPFRYGAFGWQPQISEGRDTKDDDGNIDPITSLKIAKLPDLVKALCNEGYDLIMLDYKDGATYIQRNAMLLVELIKRVNDSLVANQSKDSIIVLGASMGGQVSRFALRYMERNGPPHKTKLWIAFDSPHNGANIPLGLQYAIKWITTFTTGRPDQLKRPATKQLLRYHYKPSTGTLTGQKAKQDDLRTELYDDPNMGYPEKCKKVAIANGNGSGSSLFGSGTTMLKIDNKIMKMEVFAVPDNTDQTIFKARLSWGAAAVLGSIISPILLVSSIRDIRVDNTIPIDGSPGGMRTSVYDFEKKMGFLSGTPDVMQTYHSFIPTYSTLGLTSDSYMLSNINNLFGGQGFPVYNTNKSLSPFDVLYAPNTNEEHVQITNQNIQWLLEAIAPDCRGDLTAAYSNSSDPCASSLLLNGSGSQNETMYQWMWRIKGGSSYSYYPQADEFMQSTVGTIDLSEFYTFIEGQTYEISLITRNNCCKESIYKKEIKARFNGYKNIDEEITFENTIVFNCDVTINNGGILNIKKEMALGDGVKLTIEPGGKLNLIDGAILILSNNSTISGDLTLKNKNYVGILQSAYVSYTNGTLTVEDGSIIKLKYGSTLVFEENSNLYYQNITKNKGLILQEPNSELFLNKCTVTTPDNVDFTFYGKGHIRIVSNYQRFAYDPDFTTRSNIPSDPNPNPTPLPHCALRPSELIDPIFSLGNNSKIRINGYNSGTSNQVGMIIEDRLALLKTEMNLKDITLVFNGDDPCSDLYMDSTSLTLENVIISAPNIGIVKGNVTNLSITKSNLNNIKIDLDTSINSAVISINNTTIDNAGITFRSFKNIAANNINLSQSNLNLYEIKRFVMSGGEAYNNSTISLYGSSFTAVNNAEIHNNQNAFNLINYHGKAPLIRLGGVGCVNIHHNDIVFSGDATIFDIRAANNRINTIQDNTTIFKLCIPDITTVYKHPETGDDIVITDIKAYYVDWGKTPPKGNEVDIKTGNTYSGVTFCDQSLNGYLLLTPPKGFNIPGYFNFNNNCCPQVAAFSLGNDFNICSGQTVTYTAPVSGFIYQWTKILSDGTTQIISHEESITDIPEMPFTVYELKINPYTDCEVSDMITINVFPDLDANFTISTNDGPCVSRNICIQNTTTYFEGSSYSWSFGADATISNSSEKNPGCIKYNSSGNKTILLTVNNSDCGTTSYTTDITIYDKPDVWSPITYPDICLGESIDMPLCDFGADISCEYKFQKLNTSNNNKINISGLSYSPPKSGTVFHTTIDANTTCRSTMSAGINVTNLAPKIILANLLSDCKSDIPLSVQTKGATSYLWSTGETTQTIEVNSIGTYSVEVSDGNCALTDDYELAQWIFTGGFTWTGCQGVNACPVTLTGRGICWDDFQHSPWYNATGIRLFISGTDMNTMLFTYSIELTAPSGGFVNPICWDGKVFVNPLTTIQGPDGNYSYNIDLKNCDTDWTTIVSGPLLKATRSNDLPFPFPFPSKPPNNNRCSDLTQGPPSRAHNHVIKNFEKWDGEQKDIDGIVHVSRNATLEIRNSDLLMKPCAQIVVEGKLKVFNSRFSGCENSKWKGINIINGGAMEMVGSHISEADIGILVGENHEPNNKLVLSGTLKMSGGNVMENNTVHIKASGDGLIKDNISIRESVFGEIQENGAGNCIQNLIPSPIIIKKINGFVLENNQFYSTKISLTISESKNFMIKNNTFVNAETAIKTEMNQINDKGASISHNYFWDNQKAIVLQDGDHSGLAINCNGFYNYSEYAIYSENTFLENVGNQNTGAGNMYISNSTLPNHYFAHKGNAMNYFHDPSNPINLTTGNGYTANAVAAMQNNTCSGVSLAKSANTIGTSKKVEENNLSTSPETEGTDNLTDAYSSGGFNQYQLNIYPNPFNRQTNIIYTLIEPQEVTLFITNIYGQIIDKLVDNQKQEAGCYKLTYDATHLAPGIYYYTIKAGAVYIETKKMGVLR